MIDPAVYLTAALALVFALYKLMAGRGSHQSPEARNQILFALCLGAHFAVAAPATLTAAHLGASAAGLLSMLDDGCRVGAIHFFTLLALALRPSAPRRRDSELRQNRTTAAALAAAIALFAAAHADAAGGALVVHRASIPALAAYDTLLACYAAWCLAKVILLMTRYACGIEPGALRTGAQLITAGAAVALIWAVWSLHEVVTVLETGRGESSADPTDAVLGGLSVAIGLIGASIVMWGDAARAPTRWLRSYRQYRSLGHLWSALHAVVPAIVLDPAPRRRGPDLPLDAEFALHRRIIEIYDGRLALRPYFHPRVPDWTAAALPRSPGEADADTAVTTEAAVIAAAIEAARTGLPRGEAPVFSAGHTDLRNTAEETAWLIQVSDAFRDSPTVARIRQLVRTELAQSAADTRR
ncbi:hypothetical protein ABIA33_000522 [Streptacidiphilus sp. MAP12-16]|uniref:MAB_1171c family putative transporter n=1 Tax=Streptacidiphilus sp. MAP12-16 TaxID=3156300 RepID=UPI003513D3F7